MGGRAAARQRARAQQAATKKRFIDYPRAGKHGWRRWTPSWKQWLGTFVGFTALMLGLAGVGYAMVDVPPTRPEATSERNVYLWSDGSHMVSAGGGKNRQWVSFEQISPHMKDSVISAENATFYEDSGIDPMGIARAAFRMATGGETQSGSTITQQYVKNTFLSQDQTLKRKVKELFISIKVDAQKSKEYILEGYLNTAYYGRGAYGIQAAARTYYGKDASELTANESAFMASLLNAPNLYDPYGGEVAGIASQSAEANEPRAKRRWKWILNRRVEVGHLSAAERNKTVQDGFKMPKPPQKEAGLKGQIGYLVDLAKQDVLANSNLSKKEIDGGGYQIKTTFDKKKVKQMEDTVKKVRKENLKPDERDKDKFVQFGGASVKPGDGAVVAVYGGVSAVEHWNNNADYTGAPVGSTFKPFVMAAALEHGLLDPDLPAEQSESSRIPVSPKTKYDGDSGLKLLEYNGETWLNKDNEEWHTPNEGDTDYGNITLNKAMQVSANTPFIQLGMDVGLEHVEDAALDAGLSDKGLVDNLTPSYSLGISAPSALDLATGYATFADSGIQADPYFVTEVRDGTEVKYRHQKESERAFDSATADTITGMLEDVMAPGGTGATVRDILGDRPAAGKTGTTDDNKTAWFAGYTPELSTAIGMWRSDPEKPGFKDMYGTAGKPTIHGGAFPAEIWATYTTKALNGVEPQPFPEAPPMDDVEEYCAHDACPTEEPSPSPSESDNSPSPSPVTPTPTPSPSDSCHRWFGCDDEGTTAGPGGDTEGADGGTTDGGMDGGTTDGGMDGGTTGGDDRGGLFGGPDSDTPRRTENE